MSTPIGCKSNKNDIYVEDSEDDFSDIANYGKEKTEATVLTAKFFPQYTENSDCKRNAPDCRTNAPDWRRNAYSALLDADSLQAPSSYNPKYSNVSVLKIVANVKKDLDESAPPIIETTSISASNSSESGISQFFSALLSALLSLLMFSDKHNPFVYRNTI